MRYIVRAAILLLSITVIACGGGGSGGGKTLASSSTATTQSSSVSSTDIFPATTVVVEAGNLQTAAPGAALAVAPKVRVISYLSVPKPGVEVIFTLTSGNGSIQNTHVLTDDRGYASPGVWTLGSEKGLQTLTAGVAGLPAVTFSASALNKSENISVLVLAPAADNIVDDEVDIRVNVTSFYQLASVSASLDGVPVALSVGEPPSANTSHWVGKISLVGRPRGPLHIIITGTDVFGGVTDSIPDHVNLDRNPVVSFASAPAEDSVVLAKSLVFSLACTDDDLALGCVETRVSFGWEWNFILDHNLRASGKDSASLTVDLSKYVGIYTYMYGWGYDSFGHNTFTKRGIFIEDDAHLSVLANVAGPILDLVGTRILFLDESATVPALKILDSSTGITETLDSSADFNFNPYAAPETFAVLTPAGALYQYGAPSVHVLEWRAGAKTELATYLNDTAKEIRVAGKWAAYWDATLQVRDFDSNVSSAINESASQYDIAANGDLVYTSYNSVTGSNIHRLRSGATESITTSGAASAPVTDGNFVVYNKASKIAMHDGTAETVLAATEDAAILPRSSYATAGGYVAYTQKDLASSRQVWRHGPSGEEQITFFGGSATIEGILNNGSILLKYNKKRYLAVPGMPLQEVSSDQGRALVRDGKFWLLIGRSVLEVLP